MNDEAVSSSMDQVKRSYEAICNNIARVIIGKLDLAHRLLPAARTRMRGQRVREIITEIIQTTPVPVETIAPPPMKR